MSQKSKPAAEASWPDAVELYHKVLRSFYGRGDAAKAAPRALSLIRMLDKLDPRAETLPGNEYRSIIAELDGDLSEAIRYRLQEIRLMDELIERGLLESAQLDKSDYADRYDLLASLYMDSGEWRKAAQAIRTSETICLEHGLRFEGAELKKDIERALRKGKRRKTAKAV